MCDPHTGTGVPPASVAEWTLQGSGNLDFYDGMIITLVRRFIANSDNCASPPVSLVDGYNLPMRITNNVGCPVADCPVDLGPNCWHPYVSLDCSQLPNTSSQVLLQLRVLSTLRVFQSDARVLVTPTLMETLSAYYVHPPPMTLLIHTLVQLPKLLHRKFC